ncbi:MAG: class B sortase [Lachnospiraceae bacterium]|nr:class B sortase [Lachnospiraceae bacterium]
MNDYIVNGRSFRTAEEYKAALRDEKKIEIITKKYENADKDGKEHIINVIKKGDVTFETLMGEDFFYELEEKHAEYMKKSSNNNKKKNKIKKKEKLKNEKKKKNVKETKKQNKKKVEIKKSSSKAKKSTLKEKESKKKTLEDYDAVMQERIKYEWYLQEKKRRRTVLFCSLVAIFCLGYVFFYYYFYEKNSNEYEHLASLKTEENYIKDNKVHINYIKEEEKKDLVVLEKYKKLFSQNKSLIGWIKIDDTNIDYPVMQTVNNEYYLDHNYNQQYDKNGSIFLDKDCDITNPGTNMIIYGHHMKSGKMFGNLKLYSSKEYYDKHPIIQFDTIYEEGRYQIMYVFRSKIYNEDEIVFKYYQFFEASTPEEFDSHMNEMAKMSMYNTGVTATYGDKLITLSTCDNSEQDGRFVVVAKKIN